MSKIVVVLVLLVFSVLFKSHGNVLPEQSITLDGKPVESLELALKNAEHGSMIRLGPGSFKDAGTLTKNQVTIEGSEGTKIHSETVAGKAALVIKGSNTTIRNIECFDIQVQAKNGACIRLQGKNLTLSNVYFHDSQQGLLTGAFPGDVFIFNSRFERLGAAGRAHSIYVGGGRLFIDKSYFTASKEEGHEIKSRASETVIENTTIASLDGKDSRLIDIPNGGVLKVYDSVLQQGNATSNSNLIGYGLEGYKYDSNAITLTGNIILLDREKGNIVLKVHEQRIRPQVSRNAIIGAMKDEFDDSNIFIASRAEANMAPPPFLPTINQ